MYLVKETKNAAQPNLYLKQFMEMHQDALFRDVFFQ